MKILILITFFIFSLRALGGTEIQNGGGGLVIDGTVATFGTANVEIEELNHFNFPSLLELSFELSRLSTQPKIKSELLSFLSPSKKRKYFKIEDGKQDLELINKIKEKYTKEFGEQYSNNKITIFAITNTETYVTLLLPDFFKLGIIEKQVVLFHELMWLTKKIENLSEMIDLEIKFQKMLENRDIKSKFEFYITLSNIYDEDFSGLLNSMLAIETEAYRKKNSIDSKIMLGSIFSADTMAALAHYIRNNYLKLKNWDTVEIIHTLQEELINSQDPFWYTKFSLLNILLNENYVSGLREIIGLDDGISFDSSLSFDEIDQLILELVFYAEIDYLNESQFKGELVLYQKNSRKKIGNFLPVKFIK